MAISLQSYNEILGKLVRKIIADTPVNDVNTGSVLLTLLEAVAAQDFENNTAVLSVLETLNIDALKSIDLDNRAADYGLVRRAASRAAGFIRVIDTSITKRATSLYAIKPAPIAGDNKIYVNDASGWDANSGELYIGRDTLQFEGPIGYASPDGGVTPGIQFNGSFYTIHLTSTLQKDHLISDSVIDRQGKVDRLITAGTVVKIPLNNLTPEIRYQTLRDAVLPAGEDSVGNIEIIAELPGVSSNAGANTIIQFANAPFESISVTNTTTASGGKDIESDDELRERLKNYSTTLARGTRAAILSAVIGVSDASDGKQVSSATIQEPPAYGEPSIMYVDDGSGFQPSTAGQSVDVLLASASGGEQFLQLSNFPLPRPQVVNQNSGPIELANDMRLVVAVDDVEEEIIFSESDFNNIASATLIEIAATINDQANSNNYSFRCRLAESSTRLLLYAIAYDAEFIQVVDDLPGQVVNANLTIGFPANRYSYISLYKNNVLLNARETAATLLTLPSPWTSLNTAGTLILSVDGTPSQTGYFDSSDFGGAPVSSASPTQWATAMNLKFAGITASATSNNKIQIKSNKLGTSSSLTVVGGTYVDDWFSGLDTRSVGESSGFSLNRQTGNLKLSSPSTVGDTITAGNADSKGFIESAATNTGTYNLTPDAFGRPSEMVVVADGLNVSNRTEVSPALGTGFKVSVSSGVMRLTCESLSAFQNSRVGDFLYIAFKGQEVSPVVVTPTWFQQVNTGLFKISAKGSHTSAGVDSYVEMVNVDAVAEPLSGYYDITATTDIQVFGSDAYPQIWKSEFVSDTIPITLQQIISSFNSDLLNVKGNLFKTNSTKITSSTENDGAIAVPVSIGKLSFIVDTAQGSQLGNQSHIATRISSSDMMNWFKRGAYLVPASINTVLPDRARYTSISGTLSSSTTPGTNPSYAENLTSSVFSTSVSDLDDIVSISSGANKSLFRSVNNLLPGDIAGTRKGTPYTVGDYLTGDSVEILKSLSFSSEDSIVFVLDNDAVGKTINVNFWRTGRVNSLTPPLNSQFSADDADNESGINFGTLSVWSTLAPINTNFEDYSVMFRSRNWYRSGGSASSDGTMIVRAKEYGPIGDTHRFSIDYPSSSDQTARVEHTNNPEYTITTYYFGSDSERATGVIGGTLFSVKEIQTLQVTAQGAGAGQVSSGDYFYLQNAAGKVVFWYAVNNDGTAQPTVAGAVRYVKINSVNTGDSANTVAQKTSLIIDDDESFSSTYIGDTISFFNNFNAAPVGNAGQSAGLAFVFDQATDSYRYTFIGGVNFSSVLVGDVISINSSIGISSGNEGTFRINVVSDSGKYIDVYNPNATQTSVGQVDKFTVSNVAAAGIKMVQNVTTTAQGAGAGQVSSGDYFMLYDQSGSVVFWYDVDASGTIQPSVPGAGRFVKIDTVNTGDSAATVASKTSIAVGSDTEFETSYTSGSSFNVTNNFVGSITGGTNGSGLSFVFSTTTAGVIDQIGGTYFKTYDDVGSVAVWFNVNGETIPPHGCSRAIQVILLPGDSATTVAEKIAAAVDADAKFTANSSTTNVYIANYYNGARGTSEDGASPYDTGFTVTVTQVGSNNSYDAPTSNSGITIFPLLSTDVASIVDIVNSSETLTAVAVGLDSLTITKATKEELLPVSYGHDVDPLSGENQYVRMYDGHSWVRSFANSNPNFILKSPLTLQGEQPTIYSMSSCPNPGTADVGEFFKLVPKTIKNVHHHLSHKALSQLLIVADVDVAGDFRRIQIKSKKLGTQGAVEIVGGRANIGELELLSASSVVSNDDDTVDYLSLVTSAYPNTLNQGDVVKVYNTLPSKRKFNPDNSVKIDVVKDITDNVKYLVGSRDFNFSPWTRWSTTDVSATYGAASGTVWRWTHNPGGAKSLINGKVQTYSIQSIVRTSGTATVTLSSNHTMLAGQPIVISGIIDVPAFNGTWTVLIPGSNTFQFTSPGTDTTSNGGTVTSVETQSTQTFTYDSSGTLISSRIRAYDFSAGNSSTPFTVSLAVDTLPNQADYFLITGPAFNSPGSTPTFAVWFDVDSAGTTPDNTIGTPYNLATYKIEVNILSTDSPNEIASKLSASLTADTDFSKFMISSLEPGTSLSLVQPGDVVNVWPSSGDTHLVTNWPMGNQSQSTGAAEISGMPILSVNSTSRYIDVINPNGRIMTSIFTSLTGNMSISPAIMTRFRLKHAALNRCNIVISTNVATADTSVDHGFSIGDSVTISDTGLVGLTGNFTVTHTPNSKQFKFSVTTPDASYVGNCILNGNSQTQYKITSLDFKDLYRIERAQGTAPNFADCGVCVDDFVEISGLSFNANNRGRFRILGIDNSSIIVQNSNGFEELNTYAPLNYIDFSATWTIGSNLVTGVSGTFSNVSVGDWVRSVDDGDGYFAQVANKTDTVLTLGQVYRGPSGVSQGVVCNFVSDIDKGSVLLSVDDLKIYECDSVLAGDSLIIDTITDEDWFTGINSGNKTVTEWGSDIDDRAQYLMITNPDGVNQADISLSVRLDGFYLLENELSLYESIRVIENTSISRFNFDRRVVYATPSDRTYKISSDYGTKIQSLGKIDFPLGNATGIDGYLYYTGLMRTVQRVIDGYEPDSSTYSGQRAVGSTIEPLPPLIKTVSMILIITTRDGVNLNDITNDIKSTVISYVSALGVGEDVILSEIIKRVKSIIGVDAVTFSDPSPSLERIPVSENEKALTSPDLISLS